MNVWGDFATVFLMATATSFGLFTGIFLFIVFVEWWKNHEKEKIKKENQKAEETD